MRTLSRNRHTKKRAKALIVLLGCCALTFYFVHHTVYGRFGLETKNRMTLRSAGLAVNLKRLETERRQLRRDIKLLGDNIDRDMLEEHARRILGYAYPADRVVVTHR